MSQLPDLRSTDEQPTLTAGGVTLRPWRPADALQLVKAFGDPDIRAWHGQVGDEDQARRWIARWHEKWASRDAVGWAVTRTADPDTVVGQVALRTLHLDEGFAEFSYWVVPDYRREGIATRATRMVTDWALTELDLCRLEVVHSVRNWKSCQVAQRAGFPPESFKRSLQRLEDGKVHDMHLHAMVRRADERARPLDRALLGIVSDTTLWTSASVASAGAALLALAYRAAVLPLVIVACLLLSHSLAVQGAQRRRLRRLPPARVDAHR